MAFYLCNDPKKDMPEGVVAYIYAHEKPRFLAILMVLDAQTPVTKFEYFGATVTLRYVDPETKELVHYLLMVKDRIDEAGYEVLEPKLRKAADWFMSILADDMGLEKIGYMFLDPYSAALPQATLIEFAETGEHLLIFGLGAKGFNDLDSALQFMHKELGIAQDVLFVERMVNRIG
jgi:hypothetical protein